MNNINKNKDHSSNRHKTDWTTTQSFCLNLRIYVGHSIITCRHSNTNISAYRISPYQGQNPYKNRGRRKNIKHAEDQQFSKNQLEEAQSDASRCGDETDWFDSLNYSCHAVRSQNANVRHLSDRTHVIFQLLKLLLVVRKIRRTKFLSLWKISSFPVAKLLHRKVLLWSESQPTFFNLNATVKQRKCHQLSDILRMPLMWVVIHKSM